MHRAMMFRIKGKCTLLRESVFSTRNLKLDPRSLKLKTRSSRRETRSSKVSKIENRVSCLKNRDASDCQLTFERYCTEDYKRIPPLATAGNQKHNPEAYNFPLKANEQSKYSRTSLIWTPKGQIEVSVLERCPYKRGHYDDVTSMTALTVLSVQ